MKNHRSSSKTHIIGVSGFLSMPLGVLGSYGHGLKPVADGLNLS